MARIRTIKPEFWEDEKIGKLSAQARLLFICSMNLADDEGILKWNESYIASFAFMYDDYRKADVLGFMRELEKLGLVVAYQAGDMKLAMIRNFRKHQVINRPQPSKYPKPSEESVIEQADTEEEHDESDTTQEVFTEDSVNNNGIVSDNSLLEKEREKEQGFEFSNENFVTDLAVGNAPPVKPKIPYERIQVRWNEICTDYPTMTRLTDKRKDKIRVRWSEWSKVGPPLDVACQLFSKMQASNFMRGDNRSGWKASFDWLVSNADNWVKVYEGKYDNRNAVDKESGERARRDNEFAQHAAAKLGLGSI